MRLITLAAVAASLAAGTAQSADTFSYDQQRAARAEVVDSLVGHMLECVNSGVGPQIEMGHRSRMDIKRILRTGCEGLLLPGRGYISQRDADALYDRATDRAIDSFLRGSGN